MVPKTKDVSILVVKSITDNTLLCRYSTVKDVSKISVPLTNLWKMDKSVQFTWYWRNKKTSRPDSLYGGQYVMITEFVHLNRGYITSIQVPVFILMGD
ncbi:Uncharacterised protein [Klebsiella oxytoca]|jgi:hypothetical protein|nr:Uncharacterised protein [Klebsiella oxytoca]SBM38689.1 Uncharacterised protein [Klebsiella oxytoca]